MARFNKFEETIMALPSGITTPLPPMMIEEDTNIVRENLSPAGVKFISENIDNLLSPECMQRVCNEALDTYISNHLQHAIIAEMCKKMEPMITKIISDNNLVLQHGIDLKTLVGQVVAEAVNRMEGNKTKPADPRQFEMDIIGGRAQAEAGKSIAESINRKMSEMIGKLK